MTPAPNHRRSSRLMVLYYSGCLVCFGVGWWIAELVQSVQ
jgi:hypothetical protein